MVSRCHKATAFYDVDVAIRVRGEIALRLLPAVNPTRSLPGRRCVESTFPPLAIHNKLPNLYYGGKRLPLVQLC